VGSAGFFGVVGRLVVAFFFGRLGLPLDAVFSVACFAIFFEGFLRLVVFLAGFFFEAVFFAFFFFFFAMA